MPRWEYLQVYVGVEELEAFQEKLDEYGESRWELVSMIPIQTKHWLATDAETSGLLAVFKRQKQ